MDYKIRVKTKDGKNYLMSYSQLRNKLGLDDRIDYFVKRIIEIENVLIKSFEVEAEQRILKLIEQNANIRTGDLTTHFSGSNRFMHDANWHAWDKLQHSNQIVATSHGKGKHKRWNIGKD